MRKARGAFVSLGVMAILFALTSFTTIINFITDYQWFQELGYEQVFLTKLMTQLKIGIPIFVVLTLLIYFYLRSIKKSYNKKIHTAYVGLSEKKINQIALGISAIVSFLASVTVCSNLWFEVLKFFNTTKFNIMDPLFKKDLSFYMFQLPFIEQVYYSLISFIVLLVIITVVFYLIMMSVKRPKLFDVNHENPETGRAKLNAENGKQLLNIAFGQLTTLGVIFFILLGLGYVLKTYNLLYSTRGVAYGASFTDIHVTLWVYRAKIVFAFVSAVVLIMGAKARKLRLALAGPVIMIVVSILGNVAALGVQNFIVTPDEISKESKYLDYNIKYTKMAYGLDQIEEKNFSAERNLTRADLDKNKETIKNIRINDYRPTKQFYNQIQGIRQYYQFHDVDIDRYTIDGQLTQVFLSGREINEDKIKEQWINQHLKYTHGYGVALSPVNAITSQGQPDLFIKDIPPKSNIKGIGIKYPQIYFGELTNNYVVTNTDEKEFDYPSGDSNAETLYEGKAGIKLGGINKLLYAIKEGNLKLLISGNINKDSKILIYRNIKERVQKIAPFIEYDDDPYLVIDEGKLYWILDGYTISSNYPYAEPFGEGRTNYIRNSVKVVIDAYNGGTTYYVADEKDPVIKTMKKIFPQLFTSMDKMPDGMKNHVRYPQALFDIQANVYKVYHMADTEVFYQQEDLWDIANEIYERETQVMESNYFVMRLPDEKKEEFLLTIPYTPKNKPNMTAILMARNDGKNYGKLVIYKMPKQKNVYGPMQIESKIDQDTTISKEFSLWGQKGSTYMRGNLLTIPIENSLLYIEPIYLKADNENSLPEVKRVVVAYGDKIAYEETLEKALDNLFGGVQKPEVIIPQEGVSEPINAKGMIQRANQLFNQAQMAQRNGKWADYGKYIGELKTVLEKLNQFQNIK
ncbi:hypothetical protein EV214_1239 [Marinisporobacter balticus]|uniref:UPF0182 protein EV214_1239 n=1 Tax=Marinisporobacter balticus TaxID=2018667 RepID=A0A4R2KFB2_9FIRM|nr:UPF0182 family protein [Marinisporobacter balticus]TCO71022.1 hypothetical protein EV214_1239 [Marinisporobacter balticus]